MTTRLTRRRLVLLAVGIIAGSAAGWRRISDDSRPTGLVAELFDDYGAARAIGRAYLENHPDERARRRLLALLSLREDLPPSIVREQMRAAVRDDYVEARVVLVQGWYLARTEARLCALVASS